MMCVRRKDNARNGINDGRCRDNGCDTSALLVLLQGVVGVKGEIVVGPDVKGHSQVDSIPR